MKQSIRYTMISAITIMVVGFLIFQIFPKALLELFDASEDMIRIGVPALRIISFSFPVAGFCIAVGSVFQAVGYSLYTMINSLIRQLIVLIPCAFLLSRLTGNINSVWLSFVIAEVSSLIVTLFFYRKIQKEVIDKL